MSPALLDSGVQSRYLGGAHFLSREPSLGSEGQVSTPCFSSGFVSDDRPCSSNTMNPSDANDVSRFGFQTSNSANPYFQFSSPSTGKPDSINEVFGTAPGLSRPKVAKTRKSQHFRSMVSSEARKFDRNLNPSRPLSGDFRDFSSVGLDPGIMRSSEYGFGKADNEPSLPRMYANDTGSNSYYGGDAALEKLRDLKLDNEKGSVHGTDSLKISDEKGRLRKTDSDTGLDVDNRVSSESQLLEEIQKLSIENSRSREASRSSAGKYVKLSGDTAAVAELPNDLKKLNIQDQPKVGGDSFVFGSPANSTFMFGNRKKDSDPVVSAMADIVANKMKNLDVKTNINDVKINNTNVHSAEAPDSMILDDLRNLNIEVDSTRSDDQFGQDVQSKNGAGKSIPKKLNSQCVVQRVDSAGLRAPNHQANDERFASSSTSFVGKKETQDKVLFGFSGKQDSPAMPFVEFVTPRQQGTLFTSLNPNMEFGHFGAKIEQAQYALSNQRKGKLRGTSAVQLRPGDDFLKEKCSQKKPEPSECYSPMDTSPYQQMVHENKTVRKTSLPAEASFHSDIDKSSNCSLEANNATDEDLLDAIGKLDIDDVDNAKCDGGKRQDFGAYFHKGAGFGEGLFRESVPVVQSESFKTALEDADINEQSEEVNSSFNDECETSGSTTEFFSASASGLREGGQFTFAASSSNEGQGSQTMRLHKKKNRVRAAPESLCSVKDSLLSGASSSMHFSSNYKGSSLLETGMKQTDDVSSRGHKGKLNSEMENTPPSTTALAAKEACEKWRLRGNQAYTNGELDRAEYCYTQGVNCISQSETLRDTLRALMLCYSNRAAIRMSHGRYRDALRDCMAAFEIDPTFFRVRVRTANCYLVLGEVADASRHFLTILESGTDACADRKLIVEASDGLQKAQKASECMDQIAQLSRNKTSNDAQVALQRINEALMISPYSETLLEMKAEALFMMHRYEEVISLCEQTLESAETNFPLMNADYDSSKPESAVLSKKYHCWIWRLSFVLKSYFYRGKVEEGLNIFEKQVQWQSIIDKYGKNVVESAVPLLASMRNLLQHKSAGNVAYQEGKHAVAIEHYTAALGCCTESRPFAAICFGNRAAAYQALGQITDAIADCNLAIALDRNYWKAISRRATLFEMIRDFDQAACDLQKVVLLLTKQVEENAGQIDRGQADLRQAHTRLSYMEDQANKEIPLDFYLILNVDRSATSAELKKAYHRAALKHHPDKAAQFLSRSENGDDGLWKEIAEEVKENADKLFKIIGEAYTVLSDPTKRFRYEEAVRNTLRKPGSGRPLGTRAEFQRSGKRSVFPSQDLNEGEERWKEVFRTYANPQNPGFDPSERPSRFF